MFAFISKKKRHELDQSATGEWAYAQDSPDKPDGAVRLWAGVPPCLYIIELSANDGLVTTSHHPHNQDRDGPS